MQTMQFTSQIGQDGLLQLPLPDTWKGTEVEVLVVLQPVSKPDKNLVDSLAMPNAQVSRLLREPLRVKEARRLGCD